MSESSQLLDRVIRRSSQYGSYFNVRIAIGVTTRPSMEALAHALIDDDERRMSYSFTRRSDFVADNNGRIWCNVYYDVDDTGLFGSNIAENHTASSDVSTTN